MIYNPYPKTLVLLVLTLFLFACDSRNISKPTDKPIDPTKNKDLVIPAGIYDVDQEVEHLTVKILPPEGSSCEVTRSEKNYEGCTLSDVLNDLHSRDSFKPEVKVSFSTSSGFYAEGTLRQRGGATRHLPVKSFRIKLNKKGPAWHGEHRIQLLKTFGDPLRMRYKLNYELVSEIESLPSMQTRYVTFSIEDKGKFTFEEAPIYDVLSNYKSTELGIYLQVEYFGKEYLKRRKWPKDSRVYKAEVFRFNWNSEAFELDAKGKPKDKKAFEKRVEIKSGKDHRAFVEMLQAVNKLENNFNKDVLKKYFNRENYINWMAVNLLSGNWDTRYNNFYLYNPKGTKKFYFVPWDFDNSYKVPMDYSVRPSKVVEPAPFWNTHALYWFSVLHRRFIKGEGNVAALKERIIALRQSTYSNENIKEKLEKYSPTVRKAILKSPDNISGSGYAGTSGDRTNARFDRYIADMTNNADLIYKRILKNYDSPMPFEINKVEQNNGLFKAEWTPSLSLAGSEVTYDLLIAKTWHFKTQDIVERITGLKATNYEFQLDLAKRTYYVKVIARDSADPQNRWQVSKDRVNSKFYGIREIVVD